MLLVTAAVSARPDRNPLAWLLRRPDRWSLVRRCSASSPACRSSPACPEWGGCLGLPDTPAWVLSIAVGTVVVGAATFYLCQHEQMLLIEKQKLSRERPEAGQNAPKRRPGTGSWPTIVSRSRSPPASTCITQDL